MPLPVAVVLAAGVGRRLSPLTDDRPKALIELGGKPLLGRALDALAGAGWRDIVIVTGYRAQAIAEFVAGRDDGISIRLCENRDYARANNVVSFLAAAGQLEQGFCLLNSDIVFDASILRDVADVEVGCWIVVDRDEPLGQEEMKVLLDDDGRVRRISKSLVSADAAGEYIGIARFDATGALSALDAARALVRDGMTDRYYEDAFDRVLEEVAVRPLETRGRPWSEIDDHNDLRRALAVARSLDATARPPQTASL